jgi:hypothetical protein
LQTGDEGGEEPCTSYRWCEIVWAARLADVFEPTDEGPPAVNVAKLDEMERVELPALAASSTT